MKLTMTITLTEHEARLLWQHVTEDDQEPPLGQALADWAAQYAMSTLESTWQYDAGVFAAVSGGGVTDTPDLLQALQHLGDTDSDERTEIIENLCGGHKCTSDEAALAELRAAYAQCVL